METAKHILKHFSFW